MSEQIRIRIGLASWIRIRIRTEVKKIDPELHETNSDPQHKMKMKSHPRSKDENKRSYMNTGLKTSRLPKS